MNEDELKNNSNRIEYEFYNKKNYLIIPLIILFLFLCANLLVLVYIDKNEEENFLCGDGTPYYECSNNKPYFCEEGFLKESPNICGCPENSKIEDNNCISEYKYNQSFRIIYYKSYEEDRNFYFPVYFGVVEYLRSKSLFIHSEKKGIELRQEYKLARIDEELQRNYLIPLVINIQNIDLDKREQAKIAISLVQNIPYKQSQLNHSFFGKEISYSRYPYEVLYENQGVCGEKADLLSFLLKEIGYEVVVFYFPNENHEAVGIACPKRISYDNTGYCFIETTAPPGVFVDSFSGELTEYQILYISEGESLRKTL